MWTRGWVPKQCAKTAAMCNCKLMEPHRQRPRQRSLCRARRHRPRWTGPRGMVTVGASGGGGGWRGDRRQRMILGIGSDLANIERIGAHDRALRRAVPRTGSTPRPSSGWPSGGRSGSPPTPSAGRRRRPARRRSAPASGWGSSGRTWASSTSATGQPTMRLTGWAAERLAAMTPPGHRAARPCDADRRPPLGDGRRGHRGGAGDVSGAAAAGPDEAASMESIQISRIARPLRADMRAHDACRAAGFRPGSRLDRSGGRGDKAAPLRRQATDGRNGKPRARPRAGFSSSSRPSSTRCCSPA